MQITKKVLTDHLADLERDYETYMASANRLAGAISMVKSLIEFEAKEEPVPLSEQLHPEISEENYKIQQRDEQRIAAIELAKLVEEAEEEAMEMDDNNVECS